MDIEKSAYKILQHFDFEGQKLDLISSGYVLGFKISNNKAHGIINITQSNKDYIQDVAKVVEKKLLELDGISEVSFGFTGQKPANKLSIKNVKRTIIVSSGKGGVGKSTMAFLTALKLKEAGLRVGIVDADIYGPSLPTLTNIHTKPEIVDNQMIPHVYEGIQVNSIGYLIPEGKALIWRGPMLIKALHQLLYGTKWGELDVLIVDMPPGTGDIHLTIAEKYKISDAMLVTTPHSLSLADFSRAVDMYRILGINILGVIENMSYFESNTNVKHELFSNHGNLDEYCKTNNLNIIARIPLCQNPERISSHINILVSKMYDTV